MWFFQYLVLLDELHLEGGAHLERTILFILIIKKEIMISEILSNIPMNINFESEWFPVNVRLSGKDFRAASLQLSWNNVSVNPDAVIEIYVSNNQHEAVFLSDFLISSLDTKSDAKLIILSPSYEYIRLKYIRRTVTSGLLNAIIYYQ